MPSNPPEGMPRITPYLFYNDLSAALTWLEQVLQFERQLEMPGPDGTLVHAEMRLEDGVIMMGKVTPECNASSPMSLPAIHQSLYVYVDDLEQHYQHAAGQGAEILSEPAEMFWGDRMYSVQDLEGHQWSFAQHVRDISPEQMKPDW